MKKLIKIASLALGLSVIYNQVLILPMHVRAATGTLTSLSDTQSRLKVNTASTHLIKFKTSLPIHNSGNSIKITFPADFDFTSIAVTDITFKHNAVAANVSSSTAETLALTTPTASAWGVVFSGTENRIMELTAPTDGVGTADLVANEYIEITYASTHAVNAASPGSYTIKIDVTSGAGNADNASGSINVVMVTNDQVAVSASVDAALTFTISTNSVGFGNLVGTALRYATSDGTGATTEPGANNPIHITASSNAINGVVVSAQDASAGATPGLYSAALSETIVAAADTEVVAGSKKYGIYVKNASTMVADECFDNDSSGTCSDTATTTDAALSRTVAKTIASYNAPGGGSFDIALKTAADATTKAGAYAATLTLICTGQY